MRLELFMPGRNSGEHAGRCLETLIRQDHSDWLAYVYDDCSTDGSLDRLVGAAQGDGRIKIMRNSERQYMPSNLLHFVESEREPADIVVQLDTDDWLLHQQVLTRIIREYEDGADATLGSAISLPWWRRSFESPKWPNRPRLARGNRDWTWTAPRTMRSGLLKHITRQVVTNPRTNHPYRCAGDCLFWGSAAVYADNPRHIKEPLYVINRTGDQHDEIEFGGEEQSLSADIIYAYWMEREKEHLCR